MSTTFLSKKGFKELQKENFWARDFRESAHIRVERNWARQIAR